MALNLTQYQCPCTIKQCWSTESDNVSDGFLEITWLLALFPTASWTYFSPWANHYSGHAKTTHRKKDANVRRNWTYFWHPIKIERGSYDYGFPGKYQLDHGLRRPCLFLNWDKHLEVVLGSWHLCWARACSVRYGLKNFSNKKCDKFKEHSKTIHQCLSKCEN